MQSFKASIGKVELNALYMMGLAALESAWVSKPQ